MSGNSGRVRYCLGLLVLGGSLAAPLSAQRVNTTFLDTVLVRLSQSGESSYQITMLARACTGHDRLTDRLCQGLIRSRVGGWQLVPDGRASGSIEGVDPLPEGVSLRDRPPGGPLGITETFGNPSLWTAGDIQNGVRRLHDQVQEASDVAHLWYGLAWAAHQVEHRPDSALVLLDRAAQVGGLPPGLLALARARALLHLGHMESGTTWLITATTDTSWVTQAALRNLYAHLTRDDRLLASPSVAPFDRVTMARVAAERLRVPPMTRPLVMRSRFYRLDTATGASVVVPLAVYRQTLRPTDTLADGREQVTLQVQLIAVRAGDGMRLVVDTLRRFALPRATLPPELDHSWLQLATAISLPPGTYGLTWVVTHPDGGGFAGTLPPVEVPEPGRGLHVSSLMTGVPVRGLPWPVGGAQIGLNPVAEWREGETVSLAAIVSGLRDGEDYRSTLRIFPMQGPNLTTPLLTVATDNVASGPLTRWARELVPDKLPQGSYCLHLTITRGADSVSASNGVEIGRWTPNWGDWLSSGTQYPLPQPCFGARHFHSRSYPDTLAASRIRGHE